ncbi:MAG: L-threonylcarbamoyladenylate synthase [Anaerovibrio sp.]|nr:L-threonylcarbamoyladenylate synthase [Anaerovibrio sp.]
MLRQGNFHLHTEMVQISNLQRQQQDIRRAAEVLKAGGLVAFPTETVYGIGALALEEAAVEALYAAKNRPRDKAFSLQVADINMVQQVAACVPQMARRLMEKFCPGPITLVLPKGDRVSYRLTGGRDTVGVRIPDHPIALALLRSAGVPLAVPSANISGHISPRTAQEVYGDMAGRLDMILDGGACTLGRESTIVDCTGRVPEIIRHGAVEAAEIMAALG